MPKTFRMTLVDNLLITLAVVVASFALFQVPRNVDFLNPIGVVIEDLDVTDLAFSHFRNEDRFAYDTNVVVVNIGASNRDRIAAIIENIASCNPAVIALDVLLERDRDSAMDSRLVAAIRQFPRFVMGIRVVASDDADDDDQVTTVRLPFFGTQTSASLGYCNLVTEGEDLVRTCRETSLLEVLDGDTVLSFALAATQLFDSTATQRALARGLPTETIHYVGNLESFTHVDVDDVDPLTSPSSVFRNKIVVIGYLGDHIGEVDLEDRFYTPLNGQYVGRGLPDMYGAVIHANIISMVLRDDFVTTLQPWQNAILALILVILNVFLFTTLYNRYEAWYDLLALVLLALQSVLLLWITVWLFGSHLFKLDPTLSLFGIFLVGPIHDLYHDSLKKLARRFRIAMRRRLRSSPSKS